MWFKKKRKQRVIDIINELRDDQAIRQKLIAAEMDRSTIYKLDIGKINNIHSVIKVITLLDNNGMTFILSDEEKKHFIDILKNKHEQKGSINL